MHSFLSRSARFAALSIAVAFVSSVAHAQMVADPNAIELRPFVTVLDSANPQMRTTPIYNIGDLDGNGFDDLITPILVTDDTGRTTSEMLIERFGANGIMSADTLDGFNPTLIADWDGDGRKDIFQIETPGGYYRYWLNRGIATPPYFAPAVELFKGQDLRPTLIQDLNGDGIPDLIASISHKLYIFYGPLLTADTLVPNDSIAFNFSQRYTYMVGVFVGHFTDSHKKQLLLLTSAQEETGAWMWSITARLYPSADAPNELWNSTPAIVYTDTISAALFVYTAPAIAADFTADGFDDFLIGDSAHVYVYNGGPTFGSRLMHNADASLVLTSPHMLAPTRYRTMSYPQDITFLGDITGSGIPYIAVDAATNQDSVGNVTSFFYAGGAALDPFYDATLTWPIWYSSHLLPVRSGSVPALVFTNQVTGGMELDLLRDGLANLPHTQRSRVARRSESSPPLSIEMLSNGNVALSLPEDAVRLRVYNTIGELVEARPLTAEGCTLASRNWPHGAYTIAVEGKRTYFAQFIR
jgi:hypothetical protein